MGIRRPRLADLLDLPDWPAKAWRGFVLLTLVLFALWLIGKVVIAANVELFWDEAFNWQSGYRPDWSYVETPFVTAFLVRLGVELFGDTAFGVRAVFVALWAVIPLLVYWIALPLVGRRTAFVALFLALYFPIVGMLGTVATAETPMAVCALVAVGAFERAMRTRRAGWWCLMGAAIAVGFASHIRFGMVPLAFAVFLLTTHHGRAQLPDWRLWLAAAIGALGLVPIVLGGLGTEFHGVRFGFIERHPWRFHPRGLLHLPIQIAIVTPLYYAAVIGTVIYGVAEGRRGNRSAALIATFTASYVVFFAILTPWADQKHFNLHWPVIGYLPALALLPAALSTWVAATPWPGTRTGKAALVLAMPVTGAAGALLLGAALAVQIWPSLSPAWLDRAWREPIMGWAELARRIDPLLPRSGDAGPSLVAAIDFKTGSQLAFHLDGRAEVYVLRHRDNETYGMWSQYLKWGLDGATLRRRHAGRRALIPVEQVHYEFQKPYRMRWRAGLCDRFDDVRLVGRYEFPHGRRHYEFYLGTVRPAGAAARKGVRGTANCGAIPDHYVAQPSRGRTVFGTWDVWGWIVDPRSGVARVEVLVDGRRIGQARYGIPIDLSFYPWLKAAGDPQVPRVGFNFQWDTRAVPEGKHTLAFRVVTNDGRTRIVDARTVFVARR